MGRRMRVVIMAMELVFFGLMVIIQGRRFISWWLRGWLRWLDLEWREEVEEFGGKKLKVKKIKKGEVRVKEPFVEMRIFPEK
jgi:hypothetical protein